MPNTSRIRFALLAGVLIASLVALWGRFFCLQILDYERYCRMADNRHTARVTIPANRGKIYDCNGRLLATSVMARSVFVSPVEIEDVPAAAAALAGALDLDAETVREAVKSKRAKQFLWIKRLVNSQEEAAVRALRTEGVHFREEPRRFYPNGKMLAHVLGFTDTDQRGLAGAEFAFNSYLRGKDGYRREGRDGRSRSIFSPQMAYQPARDGNNLVLTVDTNIQDFLEAAVRRCCQQYSPLSITGIVMDPNTGAILALAERPEFDPNHFSSWPKETWRLRTLTDPFEPGSMFKPFVFTAGLEAGGVKLDDTIFCENGLYMVGRRALHDHHAYGKLSARDVVVKSSNIGMAKIAQGIGPVEVYSYLRSFGFGRKSGIELSAEDPGVLVPLEKWSHYTLTSVPMGHEVSVTALQMATAFSAFANGGYLVKPRILRGVVAPDGKVVKKCTAPEMKGRIMSAATAQVMLTDVLHNVVKRGTGRLADMDEYDIAGKTGTAQKVVGGVYSHSKYVSSFICVGPIQDPRAVVLIVVNEPTRGALRFGGTVAAPYAAEVLKATLDYMFIDGRRRAGPARYADASGRERANHRPEARYAP